MASPIILTRLAIGVLNCQEMFHKFDIIKKLKKRKIMHYMPVSIYKINNNNKKKIFKKKQLHVPFSIIDI